MGQAAEVFVGIVPENAVVPAPTFSHFKYNSPQTIKWFQQYQGKLVKEVLPDRCGLQLRHLKKR